MSEENHDEAHGPEANSQPVNDESLKARSTILLVEDDKLIRDAFITILECSGYHTSAVGTPSEALAALDRDPTIAFMITDYVLPDMNGIVRGSKPASESPDHSCHGAPSGQEQTAKCPHPRHDKAFPATSPSCYH